MNLIEWGCFALALMLPVIMGYHVHKYEVERKFWMMVLCLAAGIFFEFLVVVFLQTPGK